MNIHEYQAKEILKSFGVKIQNGLVASTTKEALDNAKMIVNNNRSNILVLKAQIHAGGRGKAGGVKVVKSIEEVEKAANEIMGKTLITPQTGPQGKKVKKHEKVNIPLGITPFGMENNDKPMFFLHFPVAAGQKACSPLMALWKSM